MSRPYQEGCWRFKKYPERRRSNHELDQVKGDQGISFMVSCVDSLPCYLYALELTARMGFKKRPWEDDAMLANRAIRHNNMAIDEELMKVIKIIEWSLLFFLFRSTWELPDEIVKRSNLILRN